MQKTSLCIQYCVWISIYVSGFYLHSLNTFYSSHMDTLILKNNHQTPYIIFYFNFFVQCWVSSYEQRVPAVPYKTWF